jgi:hypothetical protein
MSDDVRREEKRLRRIFHRALILALAAPATLPFACAPGGGAGSTGSGGGGSNASGGGESSTSGEGTTASTGSEATSSTSSGDPGDGGADAAEVSCDPFIFTPDAADMCGVSVRLPCGLPPNVQPASGCTLALVDCASFCPQGFFNCHATGESCMNDAGIADDPSGGINLDCVTCANGIGRIPAGLARARMARARSALGGYFAAAAYLEAASVHSFERLRAELLAHGAPAPLLRASRCAQRDEVRHARVTARLARRFGGTLRRPQVEPVGDRSLDTIAVENAVEGCVRETFGALTASFQAQNARDPEIARAMKSIARDETRHAALSWAVARWASRRLDATARARLGARCRDAVEALRRDADRGVDPTLLASAGLPDAAQQRAMLGVLETKLWEELASG